MLTDLNASEIALDQNGCLLFSSVAHLGLRMVVLVLGFGILLSFFFNFFDLLLLALFPNSSVLSDNLLFSFLLELPFSLGGRNDFCLHFLHELKLPYRLSLRNLDFYTD
jgi:hypothetical protein